MSQKGYPAIKLFGKTIQLRSNLNGDTSTATGSDVDCECTSSDQNILCSKQGNIRGDEKASISNPVDAKQEEEPSSSSGLEESKTLASPSTITENSKTLSNDKKSSPQDHSKEDQSDETCSSHSQDQYPPKKPDKILPCPRCNSMDTKFCYFNNYNVNQPRYLCKNCQRYWTDGGTMKNVPVGASRRKNKNSSASQIRQLMIGEKPNELIHNTLKPNKGTVLNFGSGSPLSETMALKLNIEPETRILSLCGGSNTLSNDNSVCSTENVPSTSWPYTWNPIPLPSGFPASLYSQPLYVACNSPGITSWNLHWLQNPSFCPDHSTTSFTPNSPTLGKHSRDGTVLRPSNPDNEEPMEEKRSESSRVLLPKTLRIDDPTETAKSSIWGTLAIKNDYKVYSSNVVAGFFRGFQQPKDANHDINGDDQSDQGSSMALQANPAAFSRSLSFHDNA